MRIYLTSISSLYISATKTVKTYTGSCYGPIHARFSSTKRATMFQMFWYFRFRFRDFKGPSSLQKTSQERFPFVFQPKTESLVIASYKVTSKGNWTHESATPHPTYICCDFSDNKHFEHFVSISGSRKFVIAQKAYSTKNLTKNLGHICIVPREANLGACRKIRWHFSKDAIINVVNVITRA